MKSYCYAISICIPNYVYIRYKFKQHQNVRYKKCKLEMQYSIKKLDLLVDFLKMNEHEHEVGMQFVH